MPIHLWFSQIIDNDESSNNEQEHLTPMPSWVVSMEGKIVHQAKAILCCRKNLLIEVISGKIKQKKSRNSGSRANYLGR